MVAVVLLTGGVDIVGGPVLMAVAVALSIFGILQILRCRDRDRALPAALLATVVGAVLAGIVASAEGWLGGTFVLTTLVTSSPLIILALIALVGANKVSAS
jgi:hypothetical protein